MLQDQGIVSEQDGTAIISGLDTISREIESGDFVFQAALEDIHMNIEARLGALIGAAAGRLLPSEGHGRDDGAQRARQGFQGDWSSSGSLLV